MTLWQRLKHALFGKPEKEVQNRYVDDLTVPVKKEHIQLAVFQVPYEAGPMASVRYTAYGDDGKPIVVEQIDYGYQAEDLAQFDMETTNALSMGVDVTIFTKTDIEMFPKLARYTKS
tara:strand:- start:70 stop:420 length:351 start_codon:yes stop_codon:yes gene_type:complete